MVREQYMGFRISHLDRQYHRDSLRLCSTQVLDQEQLALLLVYKTQVGFQPIQADTYIWHCGFVLSKWLRVHMGFHTSMG